MAVPLYGFTETMRGTWTPLDGSGRKTMWFRAEADATDAVDYLRRGALALTGKMHAEGLADEAPTTGRLEVQPLSRRIGYELSFRADDGKSYRFVGQKILNTTSTALDAATSVFLERLVAEEIITSYRNVKAEQEPTEPRQFNISLEATPVFPFIEI